MRHLREWLLRLWGTLSRRRQDEDIAEELRLHLEFAAEAGAPLAAAGGHAQAMEAIRDQRGLPWLDDLWRDTRESLRMLRGHPLFTAVALITLALGIGANTAIFTIVNGVILRPLAHPKPEQLMFLGTTDPDVDIIYPFSPAEYLEIRGLARSFDQIGAYTTREVNLSAGDRPLRIRAAFVDAHLLRTLRVGTAQGRLFTTEETEITRRWAPGDEPPPADVVLVSYELWRHAFGGAPLIGQTIDVDGRRREVVGIMEPGADLMDLQPQVWLPLGLNPATRKFRFYHILSVIGRLRDGVTASVALRELDTLVETSADRLGLKFDDHIFIPPGRMANISHFIRMTPLQRHILGDAGRSIWLLQAAVGLVLLIACSNLANLLLARAETRRREFAVRTALGATGGRLLRQSMTEGVLLSLGGGLLGLSVAHLGVQAIVRGFPDSLPRTSSVTIDVAVLLAAFGIALVTGMLFGLVPFAHTRVRSLVIALKEGGERGGTGAGRHVVRRGLVVVQVALAVMLVTGAALLVRTVFNLTWVDGGFDRSRLVTFSITQSRSLGISRAQAFQRVLDTLRALPGVQAATAMSELPPVQKLYAEGTDIDNFVAPPGGPYGEIDYYQFVMTDYFDTMGIPIVQGRGFRPSDAASGTVAIVNQALARTYWPGLNPIGQRLRPSWGDWVPWFTVIGVAKDIRQGGVDREPGPELFFFVDQMAVVPPPTRRTPETIHMVLRTTLPPASLSGAIAKAVHDVDPSVPVVRLRDMDRVVIDSIGRRRLMAQLLSAFAGLALLLAAVGTYGVFSFMVAERRREIGIRMALGAGRARVLAHVMTQGLWLTLLGVACGLAGAYAGNHVIASMLFGVRPTDPRTIAGVIAAIVSVAAIACWLPAFRASRLDPNGVLRAD